LKLFSVNLPSVNLSPDIHPQPIEINIRIIECDFENIPGAAIQVRIDDDPENPVKNLWILGCHVDRANLDGSANGALHIYRTHNLFVQHNLIENCEGTGINIQHASEQVICSDNIVKDNGLTLGGHGIYIGSSSEPVMIRGNMISGNGGNGIEAASGWLSNENELRAPMYVITENICVGNGALSPGATRAGIYVTGRQHVVSNNICRENGGSGIQIGYADRANRIVVQGNVVGNNNTQENTSMLWGSGISATGLTAVGVKNDQRIMIIDNLIYEEDPSGGQIRAIFCNDDVDGVLIEGNRVDGHSQPQIEWGSASSNMVVRRNIGFRTEASGSVSITPGSSSDHIDVDLASDVDLDDLMGSLDSNHFFVTPTSMPFGDYFNYRVEFITNTLFRIHWETGIGSPTTDIAFHWEYGQP